MKKQFKIDKKKKKKTNRKKEKIIFKDNFLDYKVFFI